MVTFPTTRALLLMVLGACACAPSTRGAPSREAVDAVWNRLLEAHTRGRHLTSLTFMSHDVLHPGLVEIFYPELAPEWVAWNLFDYAHHRHTQIALKGQDRIAWQWDGERMVTTRNGIPYAPLLGIERQQHMIVNAWLFWPAEALRDAPVDVDLLAPREGRTRLGIRFRTPPHDELVLEVSRETGLVHALDYTARAARLPGMLRAEFRDYRDVGDGVMVAHEIVESLPVGGVGMFFHDVTLWDVHATVEPRR